MTDDSTQNTDAATGAGGELETDGGVLDFQAYQDFTKTTAVYPEDQAVTYTALGLNGESGEVAERVKKSIRDDRDLNLKDELGDVLWYLARLADDAGYSLQDIAERNVEKLSDRQDRGVIHGEGDDR